MMLWEKSVGESRVDCSRVSCLIEEGASTRRLEVIGRKTESSTGRRTEFARRNTQIEMNLNRPKAVDYDTIPAK